MGDAAKGFVIGKVTATGTTRSHYDVRVGDRPHPYSHLFYPGTDRLSVGEDVVINFLAGDDQKPFISGRPHETWAKVLHRSSHMCHVVGYNKGLYDVARFGSNTAMRAVPTHPTLSMKTGQMSWGMSVLVAYENDNPQKPYVWGISPWTAGFPDSAVFPPPQQ
jgi:hypothetical protein